MRNKKKWLQILLKTETETCLVLYGLVMFFSPFNFFSRFWFCLNRCSRFHRRHIRTVMLILHILTETRETQFFFKTQQVFIVPIKHVSNRSSRHGVQLSGIAIVVFERKKWHVGTSSCCSSSRKKEWVLGVQHYFYCITHSVHTLTMFNMQLHKRWSIIQIWLIGTRFSFLTFKLTSIKKGQILRLKMN